jgi:hypothetical protein
MTDHLPCPFHLALITGANGCAHATPVTRRAGPDIACASGTANARCRDAFDYIKRAAQPVLGFPDNLQDAPHSVMVRLQNGGLLGLRKLLEPAARNVPNIDGLMDDLTRKFAGLERLPPAPIAAAVGAFKVSRGGPRVTR